MKNLIRCPIEGCEKAYSIMGLRKHFRQKHAPYYINEDLEENTENNMSKQQQYNNENAQIALLKYENNILHRTLNRVLKNRASRKLIHRSIKVVNNKDNKNLKKYK